MNEWRWSVVYISPPRGLLCYLLVVLHDYGVQLERAVAVETCIGSDASVMRYAGVGKKKRRLVCPLQWGKDAGNPQ